MVLPASAECHQIPRHQNQSPLRNGCHAFVRVFAPARNPIRYTLGVISLIPYPTCFCPSSRHQNGPLTSTLCNTFTIYSLRHNDLFPFPRAFRNDPYLVQASTPFTVSVWSLFVRLLSYALSERRYGAEQKIGSLLRRMPWLIKPSMFSAGLQPRPQCNLKDKACKPIPPTFLLSLNGKTLLFNDVIPVTKHANNLLLAGVPSFARSTSQWTF